MENRRSEKKLDKDYEQMRANILECIEELRRPLPPLRAPRRERIAESLVWIAAGLFLVACAIDIIYNGG